MFNFMQPITPAAKAHMDAQFSLLSDMSKQLFSSVQKINELNLQVAQTMMEESVANMQQVISAQNPQEAMTIAAGQAQPTAEKVRAYQQHLSNIAASTQVELAKTAETHVPQTTRTAAALAEEVTRRASEETEKATQRQKAMMEKMSAPIYRPADSGKTGQNVH